MKAFIPAFLWSILIFGLSAGAGINLPESFWDFISWDKVGHLTVYGVLTYLLLRGFNAGKKEKLDKRILFLAFFTSALYGILMEIMQYYCFPNRYFENLDIIANIIGSFTGLIIFQKTTYK